MNERRSLGNYYVTSSTKYTNAGTALDLVVNGAKLGGPADYEALLERQAPKTTGAGGRVRFEMESFDVQVLNPSFRAACPEHLLKDEAGGNKSRVTASQKASLLVQVVGVAQYGAGKEAARGGFAETLVLVPNWDALGSKAPKGLRHWLIMSQNFRSL
jgi:NTF2-related export protein 1/2